ncbi:MAG: hypothetical protein CM1200mP10_10290 [Candidatus Neomarinimicrobiota bacterium]|nr:MAG: hypothetical protein CM1200mP10_10290 [Candidatus Neomarinimicrobiota bacterium]
MRGVKGLVCDTSSVSPDTGLIIRGKPLLDIIDILPEQVLFLLFSDEMPDEDALTDLQSQLVSMLLFRIIFGRYLTVCLKILIQWLCLTLQFLRWKKNPFSGQIMTKGSKEDFWKPTLEDGLKLIAKLPAIGAGVYRIRFKKGGLIEPDGSLDWGSNFAQCLDLMILVGI